MNAIVNAGVVLAAAGIALSLRPWRCLGTGGPPWPWIAAWAVLPWLWGLESGAPFMPMSGAAMLLLLAGWPLAVLALLPVAALGVLAGQLAWIDALERLVWLGLVPATLMLAIGWAVRRWLPGQLFVYILGRGYFATLIACTLAGAAWLALQPATPGMAVSDLLVARLLVAFAEAGLTGTLTAILTVCRPDCLATYSGRLYLPPPQPRPRRGAPRRS